MPDEKKQPVSESTGDDQAEKGKRAGAIVTLVVSGGLIVVQLFLTGNSLARGVPSIGFLIGGSLAFIPLLIAVLVGLPALKVLRKTDK